MSDAHALFTAAENHRQAGRASEAERGYREVLRVDPLHAEAWHSLGILEIQGQRNDAAVESLRQATTLQPERALFQHHFAVALRNTGDHDAALAAFRRAWELAPAQVESGLKLAELLERLDRSAEAVEIFRQILAARPRDIALWNSLGIALYRAGEAEPAFAAYRQAISLDARRPEPHNNLGNALRSLGQFDAALASYDQAIRLKPDYARAHHGRGCAFIQQQKWSEAEAALQMALVYQPNYAEAHDDLGHVMLQQGRAGEALECCQAAVRANPKHVGAWNNLGTLFTSLGRHNDAQKCLERAIELAPRLAEAHNNLGNVHKAKFDLAAAEACYHRALAIRPEYGKAHYNLGNLMLEYGRLDEALQCYDQAIQFSPDYPEPRFQRGAVKLLRGDFAEGWPGYEWRWGMQNAVKTKRSFAEPTWDGSPLNGRTILLYTEQGLGDTFQFIRYAPLVQALGGRVVVECQAKLTPLLKTAPGIDQLVPKGEPLPKFDCQAALLSLPGILGTTVETIPGGIPYLRADPDLVEKWRAELAKIDGFKVGIVWQGSPTFIRDATRSMSLEEFEPLADVPDVQLVALQKGAGSEQLRDLADEFGIITPPDDFDTAAGAFMDTAAMMMSLDLLITSDTSAAHLAGALGRPVWVALCFAPDWRWLLGRDDSPWYPTMRLFRQSERDNWADVFDEIAAALREHVESTEKKPAN